MKKRWLSALLCTAMVAGSMAGCGLKSPETATTAAPAATEAPAETTAAETEAEKDTEAAKETEAEKEAANVPDASGDPEVTLVYAEVNPLDTIVGQTDTAFKEKVEELSGGSIYFLQP